MVAVTSPELIEVIATEELWTSLGGKSASGYVYATISHSIKDQGKATPFYERAVSATS